MPGFHLSFLQLETCYVLHRNPRFYIYVIVQVTINGSQSQLITAVFDSIFSDHQCAY